MDGLLWPVTRAYLLYRMQQRPPVATEMQVQPRTRATAPSTRTTHMEAINPKPNFSGLQLAPGQGCLAPAGKQKHGPWEASAARVRTKEN